MQANYFHKSCNKTARKFLEDFDLLPRQVKELLWYSPSCPTFEDLKEAWKLAGECFSLSDVLMQLNVFEEERKALKKEEADRERRNKHHEKNAKWHDKWMSRRGETHAWVKRVKDTDPKHARLVQRVSDEQALAMLSKRKENKDVKSANNTYWSYEKVAIASTPTKEEKPVNYLPDGPVNNITKQMHNS